MKSFKTEYVLWSGNEGKNYIQEGEVRVWKDSEHKGWFNNKLSQNNYLIWWLNEMKILKMISQKENLLSKIFKSNNLNFKT